MTVRHDGRAGLLEAATAVAQRVRRDYFEAERLPELEALLAGALDRGYETLTLSAFAERVAQGRVDRGDRILLLRHDVDDDVARARQMWEIERRHGIVGSYFFRRSTADVAFMRALAHSGNEVGYHYEELAILVKEHGVATAAEARALVGEARRRLAIALAELRERSGLALDVLASHGDFANRAVGVANVTLLADPAFRARLGVRLEAYDVEPYVTARSTDGVCPGPWHPADPAPALDRGEPVVEILIHPRAWGGAPAVNARADLQRLLEGWSYRMRRARRRRSTPASGP